MPPRRVGLKVGVGSSFCTATSRMLGGVSAHRKKKRESKKRVFREELLLGVRSRGNGAVASWRGRGRGGAGRGLSVAPENNLRRCV